MTSVEVFGATHGVKPAEGLPLGKESTVMQVEGIVPRGTIKEGPPPRQAIPGIGW